MCMSEYSEQLPWYSSSSIDSNRVAAGLPDTRACSCRQWELLPLLLPWPTATRPSDYVTTKSRLDSRRLIIWSCTVSVVPLLEAAARASDGDHQAHLLVSQLAGRSTAPVDLHACMWGSCPPRHGGPVTGWVCAQHMANKTLNGTMSACVPSAARFSANY